MNNTNKIIELNCENNLYTSKENSVKKYCECIMEFPLVELHPFKNHPFRIMDDEIMNDTVKSILKHGVIVPAIVRSRKEGGYELISGHRRKRACELAGINKMPGIIRELDDDEAVILMIDSNLQRETLLPSERAFAFKMKMEALKRQGAHMNQTSSQFGTKFQRTDELIADQARMSRNQVQRFIRLTELVSELLEMVDNKRIAFNPAVEISYLKKEEQRLLLDAMDSEQSTPSLSQAQRLKRFSQEGKLTEEVIVTIMSEEKKSDIDKIVLSQDKIGKFFPKSYTPHDMEKVIMKLLENWHKRRNVPVK